MMECPRLTTLAVLIRSLEDTNTVGIRRLVGVAFGIGGDSFPLGSGLRAELGEAVGDRQAGLAGGAVVRRPSPRRRAAIFFI